MNEEEYRKERQEDMQRHHDYYMSLYHRGVLHKGDIEEYILALSREKNGKVKPFDVDA